MTRKTRGTRRASPAQDFAVICCSIGPTTYEYWLDALGSAFDTSNSIAEDPPDGKYGVTASLLHTIASDDAIATVRSVLLHAARTVRYERDAYYVGESEQEAAVMRLLRENQVVNDWHPCGQDCTCGCAVPSCSG